ncbi:Hydrogenase isoenzymes nickel incorporation protein HypB [Clostridium sp. C105KSO13]|nr:Hydrogenase isoenzymes nickel incorporation protein HypB [Clostridium sp. C105KSO13]
MDDKEIKIMDVKKSVLTNNDADADKLREENRHEHTYYLNIMSSPGAGKTSVLLGTIECLKTAFKIGVMEADIDSDVDARTIADTGIPAIQIHTGGMCHLDAEMSRQGLRAIGSENLDLVILENVGNLVCPAEFDTGSVKNVAILSVPEGDDKPLKYPLMFQKADIVLVNKIDAMPVFDFDMRKLEENVRLRNSDVRTFPVSAKTGEGMDEWCTWLKQEVENYMKELQI